MPVKSSPKTGKLRRTCEACASVKVKCSKEKPECSRCQHRGITCQYFVEKRPGRKRQLSRHTGEANSAAATMACCCGQVGKDTQYFSGSSLSPYSFSPYRSSTMPDERGADTIAAFVSSVPGHTVMKMITNCDGGLESPHLSQNFMFNGVSNDSMAAVDYSIIFSSFKEGFGSMSAGLVDAGSEMDKLGFFCPSTVPKRYEAPFSDIASVLIPVEDTTGLTSMSESISIVDASSCGCCSSTGKSGTSPTRFSFTCPSTASLADMPARGTSPADIPETLMCQCLDQALQLLKIVSRSSRTSSSSSSSSLSVHSHYSSQSSQVTPPTPSTILDGDDSSTGFGATETQPQWFEAALWENRQCLGTIDNILACSSIDDDSMLPIFLCMILLKILDRYSDVAFSQPLLPHNRSLHIAELGSNMSGHLIVETGMISSTIHRHAFVSNEQGQMQHIHLDSGTSQPSDDERFGRVPAHLVLGELDWVQKVVNKLVSRLKFADYYNASRPTQQSSDWESRQQAILLPMEESADSGLTLSFSASTLKNMATDIQKRLTTLSSSIINQLRQS